MTMPGADPNVHWDGQQWLRWNGTAWIPQGQSLPVQYAPQPAYDPRYGSLATHAPGYAQPWAPAGPAYVTDKSGKNVQAIIAWILAVVTLGYMLPWAIAATRGKSNAGMIGVLNFLLGWTLIGWIVALVMACSAHQIASAAPNVTVMTAVGMNVGAPPPQPYPNAPLPPYQPPAQPSPPPVPHYFAPAPADPGQPFHGATTQPEAIALPNADPMGTQLPLPDSSAHEGQDRPTENFGDGDP